VVTIAEIRAARALLGWSQPELAKRLDIAPRTLKRLELGEASLSVYAEQIERVFREAGVDFLSNADDGIGVRQRL
jgi:transcriptional regulator with XRE-family HTH domain